MNQFFDPSQQLSTSDDMFDWLTYWNDRGLEWRTEPEIDIERQQILWKLLNEASKGDQGQHPFKHIVLKRDDVEWLIARYIFGYGSEEWQDERWRNNWRKRYVLDLSSAVFRKADLHGLPLTNVDLSKAVLEDVNLSDANLEGADLSGSVLERANLTKASLIGANLVGARLNWAQLNGANMEMASFNGAYMKWVNLDEACLDEAVLHGAYLEGATLHGTRLEKADLHEAHLERTNVHEAHLENADLHEASLKEAYFNEVYFCEADLHGASLERTTLTKAHFEKACLVGANLKEAILHKAHFEGADLYEASLDRCDLRDAYFSNSTNLSGIIFGNKKSEIPLLAGVRWGDVDLSVVNWTTVEILGDEHKARQRTTNNEKKDASTRVDEFRAAVRANRQLAVVLQGQGLNEEAANFSYRAQKLQRIVLRLQRKLGPYLISLFLDLVAGYGYKPLRSLLVYFFIIFGYMGLYMLNARVVVPHLGWDEALVLSLSSFHGRGFFSQDITLGDTYARLAASEAVIGL